MIGSIAFVLLGAAAAATPCENLANLKLQNATITSAKLAPEGPPPAPVPARGGARGGGGRGGGGARGDAAPRGGGGNVPQVGVAPAGNQDGAGARGGRGAGGRGGPPANIPENCRVQLDLKPTADSLIKMELWLPTKNWNGKFIGTGNG